MKRAVFLATLIAVLMPQLAAADASLQILPLKYEDTLTTTAAKQGFITVSNPSDVTVTVTTSVKGFRQYDLDGNLQFFDDPQISAGIIPGLPNFDLGPRESINVSFTVDPSKLPKGGVYGTIFFRTVPPAGSGKASYIIESANVGTLLLLQNGQPGEKVGEVKAAAIPFWQFGRGITGSIVYANTNRNPNAAAFTPAFKAKVGFGKAKSFQGQLVLPLSSRKFAFSRPGAYFGLLPISFHSAETGDDTTKWVFACTGYAQYVVLLLLVAGIIFGLERTLRRRRTR